eukprot:TRINITY_DN3830_c0_g1_i1.p1 TRINITY_DN3830_c0_g1~~TRINITY_DN3830_c0_g1_i1.p1  ORF type:complete len:962 (+),score=320.62 TRINITY_DN3830_c0_g1_i1:31-2916(+)
MKSIVKIALLVSCLFVAIYAKGELQSDGIAPQNPVGVDNWAAGAASKRKVPCPSRSGAIENNFNQDGFPCPTWDNENTVVFPGNGPVVQPLDANIQNQFVDNVLVQDKQNPNFNTLVGMAFTDNTNELFINAKAGYVFKYNMNTGALTQWLNIADQVHNAGDFGLLGIEVNKDFSNNPYVYLVYAVTSLAGPDDDMNAISYLRVIRVTQAGGVGDTGSIVTLVGKDKTDAPPLCSSTHAGGAVAMGLDGTLLITFGEGGHFDTDVMDFGQPLTDRYPYDEQCKVHFPGQNMGAFRAQSFNSLGGKLLRIDPTNGKGICPDNANAAARKWNMNPFCDGNSASIPSRIYALGMRNPYSMNVRPLRQGEITDGGPGVIYYGEVGLGSFEEVNAVYQGGLNFGWPCWEGPRPMAGYRDSPMNDFNAFPDLVRPIDQAGNTFSCPKFYTDVVTQHPTFYWARYTPGMWGLYGEQYFMGAGFVGNCVGGVGFYTGTSYPDSFKNRVFVLDYGAGWIKSLKMGDASPYIDVYQSIQDFRPQSGTPIVSLESNPMTGDICYLAILAAEVHCISYAPQVTIPTVVISSNTTVGDAPLYVGFSSDGTFDRTNAAINFIAWNFGDNTPIAVDPNPSHVFTQRGVYNVTCTVGNANFNTSKFITITIDGSHAPIITVLSPAPNGQFGYYDKVKTNYFAATAQGVAPFKYYWDTIMVHFNHYHPESYISNVANFSVTADGMGASSHIGTRINFLITLRVTDARNKSSTTFVRLSEDDWETAYGNNAPAASFIVGGINNPTSGQFVRFDATSSTDLDLDFLSYAWDFGDGYVQNFSPSASQVTTSHAYKQPGTYTVQLSVADNWGAINKISKTVTIGQGWMQNPLIVNGFPTPSGQVPGTFVPYDPQTNGGESNTNGNGSTNGNGNGSQTGGGNTQPNNNGNGSESGTLGVSRSSATSISTSFALVLVCLAIFLQ